MTVWSVSYYIPPREMRSMSGWAWAGVGPACGGCPLLVGGGGLLHGPAPLTEAAWCDQCSRNLVSITAFGARRVRLRRGVQNESTPCDDRASTQACQEAWTCERI